MKKVNKANLSIKKSLTKLKEANKNEGNEIEALHSADDTDDMDLDADLTESDESELDEQDEQQTAEDDDDDDDNSEKIDSDDNKKVESKSHNNILEKYRERQGKQLFIRFPQKLPLDNAEFEKKVEALSPLIIKSHKPRQVHARFCLVDFKSKEDRDSAMKSIKAAIKTDADFKDIVVAIPRSESEEFLKKLAERQQESINNKKAKARLRREKKIASRSKNFTSSIVILNLPKNSSVTDLRGLFPNAVDIQLKSQKGKMDGATIAAVTLSSTAEARTAVKEKLMLAGTKLSIRFDKNALKRTKPTYKKNIKRKVVNANGDPLKRINEDMIPLLRTKKMRMEKKKKNSSS